MTPLEQAVQVAVTEQTKLLAQVKTLEHDVEVSLEREAVLRGRIEQLNNELLESKDRADHYLRWCSEITQQMLNINMFVNSAMRKAKVEVEKGNGREISGAREAVERALEVGNESVQHEGER